MHNEWKRFMAWLAVACMAGAVLWVGIYWLALEVAWWLE